LPFDCRLIKYLHIRILVVNYQLCYP
jgi:hypothetical protein